MDSLEDEIKDFIGMIINVCIDYGSYDEFIIVIK